MTTVNNTPEFFEKIENDLKKEENIKPLHPSDPDKHHNGAKLIVIAQFMPAFIGTIYAAITKKNLYYLLLFMLFHFYLTYYIVSTHYDFVLQTVDTIQQRYDV